MSDYDRFLGKGIQPTDPLHKLLGVMPQFMGPITLKMPERSEKLGATIDLLIGAVALHHMEAAIADPAGAKKAVKMMRAHLTEKAARVL